MKVNLKKVKTKKKVSVSSSKIAILAFIRVMYCFVMAKANKNELDDDLLDVIDNNFEDALDFVYDQSMGETQFSNLFKQALDNKNTKKCEEKLAVCLKQWKDNNKNIRADVTISKVELGILNDIRSFLNKEGDNAYSRLENNATYTKEEAIYENFLPEEQDPKVHLDKLKSMVKMYEPNAENKYKFSTEGLKDLKEDYPEVWKEHNKIKGSLRKIYLKELLFLLRKSGKKLMEVEKVKKHMRESVIPHPIPSGFIGQIDEKGKLHTVAGKTTEGRMLRTNPSGKCTMNPDYNPDKDDQYVLKCVPMVSLKGDAQQLYTVDYYRKGQMKKFEKVEQAMPLMDGARAKWQSRMMGRQSYDTMIAMLCEVAYLTSGRIGTRDGNISKGHQIYGLSTLRVKHAKVMKSGKVLLQYHAKSGMEQCHTIIPRDNHSRAICEYIEDRKIDGKSEDFLFEYDNHRIAPQKINEYIRSLGLPITIHKFRTVHGTSLFRKLADKSRLLKGRAIEEKELNAEIDRLLGEVGSELGHFTRTDDGQKVTGNTALAYYINPPSVAVYYDHFKVRYPAKLQKVIDNSKESSED